ncbi:MAG: Mu transposase C-terminal domain-containing protein [Sphaerochaeta sp.]
MLAKNDTFTLVDAPEKIYSVLWVSRDGMDVYAVDLRSDAMPKHIRSEEVDAQSINNEVCLRLRDSMTMVETSQTPEKYKSIRDERWNLIHELVTMEPDIYIRNMRSILLKPKMEETGKPFCTYHRFLKVYWLHGCTKNALLPEYQKCGKSTKNSATAPRKRGRTGSTGKAEGIVVDERIKGIFNLSIQRFYHNVGNQTLKNTYLAMLSEYFSQRTIDKDGNEIRGILPKNQLPTLNQFSYWYRTTHTEAESLRARIGERNYNLTARVITGVSERDCEGPGYKFQIDATVGDVYLVSEFNRAWIIGRPVIYFVKDVFSRIITGMYIGLEGPSWAGASMALANCASDKVEYCKQHGITITKEQWPCEHLPYSILGDRGELESCKADGLSDYLDIRVENTPPYRGDLKGIVERYFNTMNTSTKPFLPGQVISEARKRGETDYRLDAKLTLKELAALIISDVVAYNNYNILRNYERTAEMIQDDVLPVPIQLWNWGVTHLSGSLRTVSPQMVMFTLMPKANALVTAKGLRFKNNYYISDALAKSGLMEQAAASGNPSVKIAYDPRDMGKVYRFTDFGNSILLDTCDLCNKGSACNGKTFDDVEYMQRELGRSIKEAENGRLEAEVQRIAQKMQTIKESSAATDGMQEGLLKTKRIAHIQENRRSEKEARRRNESFSLDTGKTPVDNSVATEDDLKDPVFALINRNLEERLAKLDGTKDTD